MHGVQDCVKILPVRVSVLRIGILHVLHDITVIVKLREDMSDTEFVIVSQLLQLLLLLQEPDAGSLVAVIT